MSLVPALVVFSVIPFGPREQELFHIADVNVGLLFIISVTSIGVYGIILGGWSSNSKYPLLASLRASAQLISYEIAVVMTLVSVVLTAGTLNLIGIVEAQREAGLWFAFVQPVACVLVFIGGLAETNRLPFDLPEAETELTGGFHTEYSGMRFSLFFLAEYANIIVISAIVALMFFGGWTRPFPNVEALAALDVIPPWVWFCAKIFFFLYVFVWIRATFPRYRYDQLMAIGWKVLIPIAIGNLVLTGIAKVVL
jgi:NADH-quinone oxidoreductase subunit H